MTKPLKFALLAVLSLSFAGCSTKFEVQSDTSWSGLVKDHSVAGSGSSTFSAQAGDVAVFQKDTDIGTLRARAKGWNGDNRWVETTATYGIVTVSAK